MNNITIRKAKKEDCAIILSFIRELADYEKLAHEVVATEEILTKTLFGENATAYVLIAEYEDKPAGFALYFYNFSTFLGRPGIYLEDLYVPETLRGKGIGKALLKELANIAVQENCGRLEWSVLDWNKPSIEFYQSLGAKPMDGWTTYRLDGPTLKDFANR
jgi:GNAT superfamily N-acetyltransferase